ncbi:MAG TPA: CorA family divalent cation transporter [Pseudolabrys sp.]|nr:CorA family divalent cation transporter [Pseudolabrys sp.]
MLNLYEIDGGGLREIDKKPNAATLQKAAWIDVHAATADEKRLVEDTLDVELSPANDYEPFQVSSHYSATERQMTMTGLVLTFREEKDPHLLKVTFIRTKNVLVSVSEGAPHGLSDLVKECENCFTHKSGRDDVFAAILDMLVDHTDNILDQVGHDLDRINTLVFQHRATSKRRRILQGSPRLRNRQLEHVLTELGPSREVLVKLRRSVLSFRRMIAFLRDHGVPKSLTVKLETFERDLISIAEAESDLSTTAGFLLDGVVGYIGLLQNKVMNVLTLVATVLTPPMVIAGIYGMNFKIMPELQWTYGYPFALGLCLASSAAIFFWMRWRGL